MIRSAFELGAGHMPDYRVFCRDGAGRFSPAQWVRADSDEIALARARELNPNARCEVWEGQRLVAILLPEVTQAAS